MFLYLFFKRACCWQVISQFVSIVTSASGSSPNNTGGYPPSAEKFAAGLSVSNFNLASLVPFGCLLPNTTFYDKLLFQTLAPLVVIALLWIPSIKRRITGTRSTSTEQSSARWSTFLLEFVVSNVSTIVVQTYVCDDFDDGKFLRVELLLSCKASAQRNLYLAFASVMVLVFPFGEPLHA